MCIYTYIYIQYDKNISNYITVEAYSLHTCNTSVYEIWIAIAGARTQRHEATRGPAVPGMAVERGVELAAELAVGHFEVDDLGRFEGTCTTFPYSFVGAQKV